MPPAHHSLHCLAATAASLIIITTGCIMAMLGRTPPPELLPAGAFALAYLFHAAAQSSPPTP